MARKAQAKAQALAQGRKAVHRGAAEECPSASRVHSLASSACNHWGQDLHSSASLAAAVLQLSILALLEAPLSVKVRDRWACWAQMDLAAGNSQSPILASLG